MNLVRRGLTVLMLFAIVASALASPLRVSVRYGQAGSQGNYICYLFRNGSLYDVRTVQNTGFVSGYADFDVPKGYAYAAMVHCTTNNTRVFSSSAYYYWYLLRLNLGVQF